VPPAEETGCSLRSFVECSYCLPDFSIVGLSR
jgi:hypothetical protein